MHRLGIDIGGTKISFVLLDNKSKIVKSWKILTPQNKQELIEALRVNIPERVSAIGIGVAGPLNKKGDLVLNPPNLKALRNCPLAKIIQKETGIPTKMENDANCFALGEALLGAARKAKIALGVTLGTGVGGGLVIDGMIYKGAFGAAGEVGYLAINGRPWEKIAAENRSDYNQYGRYLGIDLSNLINILDPEMIVLGGGMVNHYDSFIKAAKKEMDKRVLSPISREHVRIKKAALGELAGAIGAALLNK